VEFSLNKYLILSNKNLSFCHFVKRMGGVKMEEDMEEFTEELGTELGEGVVDVHKVKNQFLPSNMPVRIIGVGNSLGIIIKRDVANDIGMKVGDRWFITIEGEMERTQITRIREAIITDRIEE
jgi:antitoxin component of MazEF toxin-antitoxin module